MIRIPASLIAVAITSMALLSACAPQPAETPDASPVEEPAPSESPVTSDPAPTPLLDLSCEQLLPGGIGAGLMTEKLPPLEPSPIHLFASFPSPESFATEQVRGTYCLTSNGEPQLVDEQLNPGWVAIEARIVPNASAQFALFREFESVNGTTSEPFINCSGPPVASCTLDLLVDEHWVHFTFWGVEPQNLENPMTEMPQLLEIAAAASQTVSAAPVSGQQWTPPAETIPLGTECEQFVTPAMVATDLGITDELFFGPYEDYESAERAGRELAPALSCPWHDNNNRGVGGHSTLQGGAWALQMLTNDGAFDGWEGFELAGLRDGDSAIYSCTALPGRCQTNVVIGHNWMQLNVLTDENGLDAGAATDLLRSYTQSAVDSVRS